MTRSVLISGVLGGIGRATARRFRDAEWRVFGVDLAQSEGPTASPDCERVFCIDVGDPPAVKGMYEELAESAPRLDALVNNAAQQQVAELADTEAADWNRVMATNTSGVFLLTKHALPMLRGHGGSIVNVTSVHAFATSTGMAAYVASKGAVLALTRATALELADDGIRVNAVVPGAIDTAMLRAGLARAGDDIEEAMASLRERHPLKRVGKPEEVAEAIFFLADEKRSSFITGQSLVVDGGALARLSTE